MTSRGVLWWCSIAALLTIGTQSLQYSPVPLTGVGDGECALLLSGPGRTSAYDYSLNLLRGNGFGYNGQHTCITYDAVNAAYLEARKRVQVAQPHGDWKPEDIATVGELLLDISVNLARTYGLSYEDIEKGLPLIDTSKTLIREVCPPFLSNVECRPGKYRRFDGLCTNLENPTWGATMQPFTRLIGPLYADGMTAPRISVTGNQLPLARVVSRTMHPDEGFHDHAGTVMVIAWGQFIDHDYTLTATPLDPLNRNDPEECCKRPPHLKNPYCNEIRVPADDYFYRLFNVQCIDFVRGFPSARPGCRLGSRSQFNTLTGVLDANTVYGVTEKFSRKLRAGFGGLLRMNPVFREYGLKDLLPLKLDIPDEGCTRPNRSMYCFEAGEIRVNEQLVLTCMHTLMAREHNRIAEGLAHVNPHWDDETLFQEARRINIAEVQHITYNEFLPILLGKEVMQKFGLLLQKNGYWEGYDPSVNPNVIDAFAAAAYRFGHSLLPTAVERWSKAHKFIASKRLSDLIRRPYDLYRAGVFDEYFMGLMNQVAQAMDDSITQEVTNHLFKKAGARFGMDLVSFNMQRGREFGLPGYMEFRKFCGLPGAETFDELFGSMPNETIRKYSTIFEHPSDVDLWSGGVSERPLPGSMLGPTFACIIATQFSYSRRGDRFWYELPNQPSSFTPEQLQEIRKARLARVICDNTDLIDTIQLYPMVLPDHEINPRVPCRSRVLPSIDFTKWADPLGASFHQTHQPFVLVYLDCGIPRPMSMSAWFPGWNRIVGFFTANVSSPLVRDFIRSASENEHYWLCSFHEAAPMKSLTRGDETLAVKKPTTWFQPGNQADEEAVKNSPKPQKTTLPLEDVKVVNNFAAHIQLSPPLNCENTKILPPLERKIGEETPSENDLSNRTKRSLVSDEKDVKREVIQPGYNQRVVFNISKKVPIVFYKENNKSVGTKKGNAFGKKFQSPGEINDALLANSNVNLGSYDELDEEESRIEKEKPLEGNKPIEKLPEIFDETQTHKPLKTNQVYHQYVLNPYKITQRTTADDRKEENIYEKSQGNYVPLIKINENRYIPLGNLPNFQGKNTPIHHTPPRPLPISSRQNSPRFIIQNAEETKSPYKYHERDQIFEYIHNFKNPNKQNQPLNNFAKQNTVNLAKQQPKTIPNYRVLPTFSPVVVNGELTDTLTSIEVEESRLKRLNKNKLKHNDEPQKANKNLNKFNKKLEKDNVKETTNNGENRKEVENGDGSEENKNSELVKNNRELLEDDDDEIEDVKSVKNNGKIVEHEEKGAENENLRTKKEGVNEKSNEENKENDGGIEERYSEEEKDVRQVQNNRGDQQNYNSNKRREQYKNEDIEENEYVENEDDVVNEEDVLENAEIVENDETVVENDDKIVENDDKIVKNDEKIKENNDEIVENNKQYVKNNGRVAKNHEIVKNDERTIENNKQLVKNNEKNVENDEIVGNDERIVRNNKRLVKTNGENVENDEIVGNNERIIGNNKRLIKNNDKNVENDEIVKTDERIIENNKRLLKSYDENDEIVGNDKRIVGNKKRIVINNDENVENDEIAETYERIIENNKSILKSDDENDEIVENDERIVGNNKRLVKNNDENVENDEIVETDERIIENNKRLLKSHDENDEIVGNDERIVGNNRRLVKNYDENIENDEIVEADERIIEKNKRLLKSHDENDEIVGNDEIIVGNNKRLEKNNDENVENDEIVETDERIIENNKRLPKSHDENDEIVGNDKRLIKNNKKLLENNEKFVVLENDKIEQNDEEIRNNKEKVENNKKLLSNYKKFVPNAKHIEKQDTIKQNPRRNKNNKYIQENDDEIHKNIKQNTKPHQGIQQNYKNTNEDYKRYENNERNKEKYKEIKKNLRGSEENDEDDEKYDRLNVDKKEFNKNALKKNYNDEKNLDEDDEIRENAEKKYHERSRKENIDEVSQNSKEIHDGGNTKGINNGIKNKNSGIRSNIWGLVMKGDINERNKKQYGTVQENAGERERNNKKINGGYKVLEDTNGEMKKYGRLGEKNRKINDEEKVENDDDVIENDKTKIQGRKKENFGEEKINVKNNKFLEENNENSNEKNSEFPSKDHAEKSSHIDDLPYLTHLEEIINPKSFRRTSFEGPSLLNEKVKQKPNQKEEKEDDEIPDHFESHTKSMADLDDTFSYFKKPTEKSKNPAESQEDYFGGSGEKYVFPSEKAKYGIKSTFFDDTLSEQFGFNDKLRGDVIYPDEEVKYEIERKRAINNYGFSRSEDFSNANKPYNLRTRGYFEPEDDEEFNEEDDVDTGTDKMKQRKKKGKDGKENQNGFEVRKKTSKGLRRGSSQKIYTYIPVPPQSKINVDNDKEETEIDESRNLKNFKQAYETEKQNDDSLEYERRRDDEFSREEESNSSEANKPSPIETTTTDKGKYNKNENSSPDENNNKNINIWNDEHPNEKNTLKKASNKNVEISENQEENTSDEENRKEEQSKNNEKNYFEGNKNRDESYENNSKEEETNNSAKQNSSDEKENITEENLNSAKLIDKNEEKSGKTTKTVNEYNNPNHEEDERDILSKILSKKDSISRHKDIDDDEPMDYQTFWTLEYKLRK